MTEVKFDIVKPNLIVVGNRIYFAIEPDEVVPQVRNINQIITQNIGELKVRASHLAVMRRK